MLSKDHSKDIRPHTYNVYDFESLPVWTELWKTLSHWYHENSSIASFAGEPRGRKCCTT